MSAPVAQQQGFSLSGSTEQTILGGPGAPLKLFDDGYIIVRNKGANTAIIKVYTSNDGTNFQLLPDPYFSTDGIPATTNPQPYPLPSPRFRGEFIKITGSSLSTTVDVEVYHGGRYQSGIARSVVKV